MRDLFTIGELTQAVTLGNERAMRKMLRDAGADLDENAIDPTETVTRWDLVEFIAMRAGSREGRIARRVLREADETAKLAS